MKVHFIRETLHSSRIKDEGSKSAFTYIFDLTKVLKFILLVSAALWEPQWTDLLSSGKQSLRIVSQTELKCADVC